MKRISENYCTIYLVRHGETEWNKKGIIQGHKDSALTKEGEEQVRQAASELKAVNFDMIFSSDLHRAYRTAEIINLERKLVIQTSKALRERSHGKYDGTAREDYKKKFQHLMDKVNTMSLKEHLNYKFDADIETEESVISRFITQLREISLAYPKKNVLVVSHGGCLRTFLTHLGYATYGELPMGSISNAAYIKVQCDGIDFFIQEVKGVNKQIIK